MEKKKEGRNRDSKKTVIKEKKASKRKTKKFLERKLKKGEVRKKDEEEMSYEVEKLLDDRKFKGVWEIELKWKDDVDTTREPMAIIEVDQPKMVEDYMNELCKQKEVLTLQKRQKRKKDHQRRRLTRSTRRSMMCEHRIT